MQKYSAPLRDMSFVFHELLDVESEYRQLQPESELSRELIDRVLEEGARFAEDVLEPLNRIGDEHGCRLEAGKVTTPPGFRRAYQLFCEAGWPGVSADPKYGGQ